MNSEWIEELNGGALDEALARYYATDGDGEALDNARKRAEMLAEQFMDAFPGNEAPVTLFSSPGRTELGGNHTDHQHGTVLTAAVNMDMLALAAPNGADTIRIASDGYPPLTVSLAELAPAEREKNTSAALVRGIAKGVSDRGFGVCGFDACVTSDILSGSGLSSSAAYELLVGTILNRFSAGNSIDPVSLARIGQFAENVYFGKPCGLMDQTAIAVGGASLIDFADPEAPAVRKIGCDFGRYGYALAIIDTASGHENLTEDFAAIPREMKEIASFFGKDVLRDVPETAFFPRVYELRKRFGDRAVLRAMHFFDEQRRVAEEAEALEAGDFGRFLALVNASGQSSERYLQNVWAGKDPKNEAVPLALAVARRLLGEKGAVRVHGGGFAGTIQAYVPVEAKDDFAAGIEAVFGEGTCHYLRIRPEGASAME